MTLRRFLLKNTFFRRTWAAYRSRELVSRYRIFDNKYGSLARERGLRYDPQKVQTEVRARLEKNGIKTNKGKNSIHGAIMTLTSNWGLGMVYELEQLGPVSVFDNEQHGFSESAPNLQKLLPELNRLFLQFLRDRHAEHAIDWVLLPCSGKLILKDTLKRIREELGIPTVNQWLDCKQNFEVGLGPYGQDMGQKDIAPEFDLVWTSSRSACEWYMAVGATPIFLPEGFSPKLTPRIGCKKIYDMGFLGMCYGLRPDYVEKLRKAGLKVIARGPGWPLPEGKPVPLDEMGRFFGLCKVNLGIGGVGYSTKLTTLKGRDFEIPGAGGAYLTTYNPDLGEFFHIGHEILCYSSMEEMVELARRLVRHDSFREELAARAYDCSMRKHRWVHRFQTILEILGILKPQSEKENSNA